jgi:hypothetical protein
MQTASAPPPGAFTLPATQPERAARALPGATDVGNPSWMSFAPAAKADPAPLTAVPEARAGIKLASVPLPRPRPRLVTAKRSAAATAPRR